MFERGVVVGGTPLREQTDRSDSQWISPITSWVFTVL